MNKRCYFLSMEEYLLLVEFDLQKYCHSIPNEGSAWYDCVIDYDRIDDLARVVYARKNKRGNGYKKLISFVDRLQDILENNPDLC